ncbi:MAG: iron ABC transporter permease [Halothece sp. Uz-M2-17]|nr:iron ABC transporter permease [Halothece sp. Uz-M2-17]
MTTQRLTIAKTKSPLKKTTQQLRWLGLMGLLTFLLLASLLLSLALGSVEIPISEVVKILLGGDPATATWKDIIFQFRLPKALTAAFSGGGLAVSGFLIQTLFRNPLAGPSLLGINAGASLGVAIVVLTVGTSSSSALLTGLGLSEDISIVMAASFGAAAAMGLVMIVAQRLRSNLALLIFGLMFGYTTTALVRILLHFSLVERLQAYLSWTFGSFSGVTWSQMQIFIPILLLGLVIAQGLASPLNLLLLGEEHALSLGLAIHSTRTLIIISVALLAGTVTAFCGPIAFLGIAVPHLCRSVFHTLDHRLLIPANALMGAILALFADSLAQMPGYDVVLPLNAVTALLGAPIVTWLILRRQHQSR